MFCAMCNGINPSHNTLTCSLNRNPFSDLFQFRGSSMAKLIEVYNPCSKGEIQDPISLTCRPLSCIQGYAFQNNKCVLKNGTSVDDILGNWKCDKYDSLFFFKGVAASFECVDVSLERNKFEGLRVTYLQAASTADGTMWKAIRFDTKQSLFLFQEIDELITRRNSCDIFNVDFLTSCYQHQQFDDINCTDRWYSGSLSNFVRVSHPTYDNVYLVDGTYLIAQMVMLHATYERDNTDRLQRKDTLMICGSTYEIMQLNCLLIALSPTEYIVVNQSVLLYHNMTINDTDFSIQPDGQVLVCTESLQELKRDSVRHDDGYFADTFDTVSFVTSSVSLICLLGTLVTYARFKKLRNRYGKCIMCLCVSLFLSQVFTFLSDIVSWSDTECVVVAILTHYCWLSSFAWSTNTAVVLLQQLVIDQAGKSVESTRFAIFVGVFGLVVPMFLVSIPFALHICECTSFTIYATDGLCWIKDRIVNLVAFGVPVSLYILTNGVILAITLTSLRRSRHRSNVMQAKQKNDGSIREVVIFFKVSETHILLGIMFKNKQTNK